MSASIHSNTHDQQSKVKIGDTMQPWSVNLSIPSTQDVTYPGAKGSPHMPWGPDTPLKTCCEQFTHNVRALCAARACGLTLLPLQPWESPLYAVSGQPHQRIYGSPIVLWQGG